MKRKYSGALAILGVLALLFGASPAFARISPGTSRTFAVVGGSTVTNTGSSIITGNLGVSPDAAVTGFPPGIVGGVVHSADGVVLQAQSDFTTAYNAVAGTVWTVDLTAWTEA